MLSFMRKHAKSWLIKIALSAIVVVFVFWGIQSYREEERVSVAYVDGKPITMQEYREAYRNLVQIYRDQLKENFSQDLIKALNLEQRALNNLIHERLMLWEAHRLGMNVGEDELRAKIASYPAFQREGKFDEELYLRMLEANRMTPGNFEEAQRRTILLSKIADFISGFVKVSDEEVFAAYRHQNQRVNLSFVIFRPSMYAKEVQVSDEEVSIYYSKHKEDYRVPPQVKVGYIGIQFEDFENQVDLAEEKKGKAKELAFQRIREVYKDLIMTQDLKKAAETNGLSFQETDFFKQNEPPKPFDRKFANTAFSLKKGEMSHVLELPHGYFVVQALDKKGSYIPDVETIYRKVKEDLVDEKSEEKALEQTQEIFKAMVGGRDIYELAKDYDLNVKETGFFKRLDYMPQIGNLQEVKQEAFLLNYKNPYPHKVHRHPEGYLIFQFKEKEDVTEDMSVSQREEFKERLLFQKTQKILEEWLMNLSKEANVKIMTEIPGT